MKYEKISPFHLGVFFFLVSAPFVCAAVLDLALGPCLCVRIIYCFFFFFFFSDDQHNVHILHVSYGDDFHIVGKFMIVMYLTSSTIDQDNSIPRRYKSQFSCRTNRFGTQ